MVGVILIASISAHAQLRGRISDLKTSEPISYVNFYNLRTSQGGLSDESGNYQISNYLKTDTIEFSIIGYKTLRLSASELIANTIIHLSENQQLLSEVAILAYDEKWHTLLLKATSNFSKKAHCSKSYYLLESFRDSQQIEMLECFYNVTVQGAEINDLEMKSGRFGLHPKDGQVFLSWDISQAILQMKTTEPQKKMPVSPLQLSKKALRKAYYIRPVQEYIDENGSNIVVLEAEPNGKHDTHFSGKIWIDQNNMVILKTIWDIQNTQRHPFRARFPPDSIGYVDLTVTRTYELIDGYSACKRIDFQYELLYKSMIQRKETYKIKTHAILNAYQDGEKFELPSYNLHSELDDYRKIQALPPQDYFWKNHNELIIENKRKSNDDFLQNVAMLNPSNLFKEHIFGEDRRGFRWLFFQWSPEHRIYSSDFSSVGDKVIEKQSGVISEKYQLDIQFYMDIHDFNDTIVLQTAMIMDPMTSFYHLPMDSLTFCFINVYFDLMEIRRRDFVAKYELNKWNKAEIRRQFEAEKIALQEYQSALLKDLQRGHHLLHLTQSNDFIKEKLGIDNMAIFGIQRPK